MEDEKYKRIWALLQKASPAEKQEIISKLSDEDVIQLRAVANPYRKPLYKSKAKLLTFSHINMPREYLSRLMMTTMVGFIYKMASEYEPDNEALPSEENGELGALISDGLRDRLNEKFLDHHCSSKSQDPAAVARGMRAELISFKRKNPAAAIEADTREKEIKKFCYENSIAYESVFPQEVQLDEEDIASVREWAKKKMGVDKTLEEFRREVQDHLLDFLDLHFKYDPNNHIRCGYAPHYDKELREKISTNPEKFQTVQTPHGREMLVTKNFESYLIPPADTFFSFNNYFSSNYEHLRQVTDDIYGQSDFETAILAREVFESQESVEKWQKKYKNELDVSCYTAGFNEWIFLDPWRENREKLTYDDERGKLISEIIQSKKEEEKLGRELMSKKKKRGKKPAEKLPYTSQAEMLGAEALEKLSVEPRPEKDLEIGIFSTKLLRNRRGYRTTSSAYTIPAPSQKPVENK